MGTVVALGHDRALDGFALAGVSVIRADSPAAARDAWKGLPEDVALVILSPDAAAALAEQRAERPDVLTVVTP